MPLKFIADKVVKCLLISLILGAGLGIMWLLENFFPDSPEFREKVYLMIMTSFLIIITCWGVMYSWRTHFDKAEHEHPSAGSRNAEKKKLIDEMKNARKKNNRH